MDSESRDYTHQELNDEVTAIGGHYVLTKEVRLPFQGREVLYLLGSATFDTTCCGDGGCCYALIPGFILDWQGEKNKDGLPVSRVEPIRDENLRDEIRSLIEKQEVVSQVNFL